MDVVKELNFDKEVLKRIEMMCRFACVNFSIVYLKKLSAALPQVVFRDTATLIKSNRGAENPIKVDDTLVDSAGYEVDNFTNPKAPVSLILIINLIKFLKNMKVL